MFDAYSRTRPYSVDHAMSNHITTMLSYFIHGLLLLFVGYSFIQLLDIQDVVKLVIPAQKNVFRLYGKSIVFLRITHFLGILWAIRSPPHYSYLTDQINRC